MNEVVMERSSPPSLSVPVFQQLCYKCYGRHFKDGENHYLRKVGDFFTTTSEWDNLRNKRKKQSMAKEETIVKYLFERAAAHIPRVHLNHTLEFVLRQ